MKSRQTNDPAIAAAKAGFPPPLRIGLRPIRACHLRNRSRVGVADSRQSYRAPV
jgi:hypothetical protein